MIAQQEFVQGTLVPAGHGWRVEGRWFRETLGGRPPRLMGRGEAVLQSGSVKMKSDRGVEYSYEIPPSLPEAKCEVPGTIIGGPEPLLILPGFAAFGDLFRIEGRVSLKEGWTLIRTSTTGFDLKLVNPEGENTYHLTEGIPCDAGTLSMESVRSEDGNLLYLVFFTG